jgi:DUF4097 and DUF4098 domain-containing protein YvlB
VLVGGAIPAAAQELGFDCQSQGGSSERARHCEIREYTIGVVSSALNVDARPNGSISVIGSSRSDILVRARVTTHGETQAQAQQIAQQVQISVAPGQVSSSGPRAERGNSGWSVSFEVLVPTQTYLSLQSTNGAVSIRGVEGEIDFKTTNGAVRLANVGGQVKGATTNGAVQVELDGPGWLGPGLDVETSNGAIDIAVPAGYSARLEASTVNGQIRSAIPLTVQGRIDNNINVDLGSGGPTVKVKTRNGGVRITERR